MEFYIPHPQPLSKRQQKERQQFCFRELLRISLLVDNELSEQQVFGQMSALVKKARYHVNGEDDLTRLNQLISLMYDEWGFGCDYEQYFYSDNLLLHRVLQRKRGMPVSLGAVLLYLASVLEIPIYPVNFPTQLVIRADIQLACGRCESHFINPWDGSYLTIAQMTKWLEADVGFGTEVTRDILRIADPTEIIERLEGLTKTVLTREDKFETVLKLIEHRLSIYPDDPYEIRDRGMILAGLGCYQAAIDDLSYFVDQLPDDPSTMMIRVELKNLEELCKGTITLH